MDRKTESTSVYLKKKRKNVRNFFNRRKLINIKIGDLKRRLVDFYYRASVGNILQCDAQCVS